ncbi:DUF4365 domain-containing protein [Curtobacterium flaccumfaciens pv. oortii]|uniref:DUF4365 domain-containing protein n=1 Tax=Curtobacterium flaccumfaciens TaxID=2035 RepID=UPI0026580EE4|nr:DUF4365 domain-containing protein [Curtobacterium flaccumfaciens]MCS5521206.1 DUF4365 domain-containing protein [Curtobacterium flaccumfaciens pv. oortii]
MAKLKGILAGHGVEVHYQNDRAGLDIGLHLFVKSKATLARVWFQVKGKHASALSAAQVARSGSVSVSVPVGYVAYWYAHPEAAYLVVYVETLNLFVAGDVRELVDAQWPEGLAGLPFDQETVTLHISSDAILDAARLQHMTSHRSMRIDGPASRGRPLGHRFDPLRSRFTALSPSLFEDVVASLLTAHRFVQTDEHAVGEHLRVLRGQLHESLSWQPQLFTEIGFDDDNAVRIDGAPSAVQGEVLFVVDSSTERAGLTDIERDTLEQLLEQGRAEGAPVGLIGNRPDTNLLTNRAWRALIIPEGGAAPERFIGLEALTGLVLVATLVYLDYAPELHFDYVNYIL